MPETKSTKAEKEPRKKGGAADGVDVWTDGPLEVDVTLPAGAVEVELAHEPNVTVVLEAMRDSQRTEEAIAASEVTLDAGKLRVSVNDRALRNVEVHCELRVPEGSASRPRRRRPTSVRRWNCARSTARRQAET